MEILRQLIPISSTSKDQEKPKWIDKVSHNHIQSLENQINKLIDISISHLPSNKQEILEQQNEILHCFRKIILSFNDILSSNLKQNNPHYWDYISKYFQIQSTKFIVNAYESMITDEHKGLAWITISILENSFLDTLKEIYKQEFDKKFYQNDSMVVTHKNEILDYAEKLSKLTLIDKNQIEIFKEYSMYLQLRIGVTKRESSIELPEISPVMNYKEAKDNHFIITPMNLYRQNSNCKID